jgi:hypothetical protein
MPTVLGAVRPASAGRDTRWEGIDLWPFVTRGTALPTDLPALAEVFSAGSCARSLRLGKHKIIQTASATSTDYQLYDLLADPGERSDLSTSMPELLRSIQTELERIVEESESKRSRSRTGEIDESTRERLESLGYIM